VNNRLFYRILTEAPDLSDGKLLLALVMCFFSDRHGQSWLWTKTLAERTKLSKRHVNRLLQELARDGYLTWDPPIKDGYPDTAILNIPGANVPATVAAVPTPVADVPHEGHPQAQTTHPLRLTEVNKGITAPARERKCTKCGKPTKGVLCTECYARLGRARS
jgi:hypothetical protein